MECILQFICLIYYAKQEVENMKWYVLRVMGGKERKTVDFY